MGVSSPAPSDGRLDKILEALTALAAGRTPAEIPSSGGGDQLDALAEGVNMLAEELDAAFKALRMWNEELEQRMRDRSRELRSQQQQLSIIVQNSTDAIIACDREGIITSWNASAERLFGYTAREAVGRSILMLTPARPRELREAQRDLIGRLLTGETLESIETERFHKDGHAVHVSMSLSALTMTSGEVVGFSGTLRDARRQVAERSALEESESRHREVLNLLQIGSLLVDAEGRVRFASAAARTLLGVGPDAVGRPWESVVPLSQETRQDVGAMMAKPVGERERIPCAWEVDGRSYWAEIDVLDDPQNTSSRVMLIYDVSELHLLRRRVDVQRMGPLVGHSEAMQGLYRQIEKVARGKWTVLIEGETGSGKELVARSIHDLSPRADLPFVAINCAGLSESLLAAQLFGHRKGAFTGALSDRKGFFEAAHGGTLFLDEIGDIPAQTQVMLLRALQEGEIIRVGDTTPRKVDVRVIAATNRPLEDDVRRGRFREDLFYRLRVARIRTPPLRDRLEDLGMLSTAFIRQGCAEEGRSVVAISAEALALMRAYSWPGNVRELQNVIDHALIHAEGPTIEVPDLPPEVQLGGAPPQGGGRPRLALAPPVPGARWRDGNGGREAIEAALRRTGGRRKQAAQLLGMSRATFYRRLKSYGIA